MSDDEQQVYTILTSVSEEDLEEQVSEAMRDRWTPQGGVTLARDDEGELLFAQAMVRVVIDQSRLQ